MNQPDRSPTHRVCILLQHDQTKRVTPAPISQYHASTLNTTQAPLPPYHASPHTLIPRKWRGLQRRVDVYPSTPYFTPSTPRGVADLGGQARESEAHTDGAVDISSC